MIDTLASPLGPLVVAATDEGICLLEFAEAERIRIQLEAVERRLGTAPSGNGRLVAQLAAELDAYFAGTLREFTVPVTAPGTPFQQRVWSALRTIPFGETRSYEQLAQAVGVEHGQRAVGRANGMNPVAIVVPCHRVVNKSGALGGYGGQLWRKSALLDLERGGRTTAARAPTVQQPLDLQD